MCNCNCGKGSITIPKGPKGDPGEDGAPGPQGLQGPPGETPDSGWVNLEGFSFYGSNTYPRPQVRKIGKVLHFRGLVIIPLASDSLGTTLVPLTSDLYETAPHASVYQGSGATGGCVVDPLGVITFFNNGNLIPSSLGSVTIDGTYTLSNILAVRRIEIASGVGSTLTSLVSIFLDSGGKLKLQTIRDVETIDGVSTNEGTNPMRFLTSDVKTDQNALDLRNIGTGDSAGSTLHSHGNGATPLTYSVTSLSSIYTFNVDASDPAELGGFYFRLDGLLAYTA